MKFTSGSTLNTINTIASYAQGTGTMEENGIGNHAENDNNWKQAA
jgi:hypothetical protein